MSNKNITEEIRQAIDKHLPAQVSTMLQDRLALVDELEDSNRKLREVNHALQETRKSDLERDQKIEQLAVESREFDEKRKDIEKRAREQQVFELNANLQAERRVSEKLGEALTGLVRNTVFRRNLNGDFPQEGGGSYYGSRQETTGAE